jgi:DNA-binding SARP family transcriptional activator
LDPSPSAMNSLMGSISQLRSKLGPAVIANVPGGFELRVDWTRTDIHRFERLAAAGREQLTAGDSVQAAEMLRLALGLWRGEPFGDFSSEAWARPEVARLEELRLGAIEDQIDAGFSSEDPAILAMIARLVAHYPRRGRLRGQLIRALLRAGHHVEATHAFDEAQRFIAGEPGVDAGPRQNEIRALMSYIPTVSLGASSMSDADTELAFTRSSRRALAKPQPQVQPRDFRDSHAIARLFDDWAFRLGRGEWPDPNDYLDQAGRDADDLRLLMDTYIRALPRPAPAHEDIERAQAWLAAVPRNER